MNEVNFIRDGQAAFSGIPHAFHSLFQFHHEATGSQKPGDQNQQVEFSRKNLN